MPKYWPEARAPSSRGCGGQPSPSRHAASAPAVVVAEAALRACGYTPKRVLTGSAADANAFEAAGFPCVNLANGTERNHEPTERVSVAALEGMLDVVLASAAGLGPHPPGPLPHPVPVPNPAPVPPGS